MIEDEAAGVVRGFYVLAGSGPEDAEMAMLFVDPQWIGMGLGAELLNHARQSARQLGWPALRIEADPFAVPFYQHMGAVQIGAVRSGSIPDRTLPLLRLAVV